jgi:hypothetical protein
MSTRDLLLTKVQADEQRHDDAAVKKDVQTILHRDTNLADPKLSKERITHDLYVLRDFGVSEKELKDLGFPSSDHLVKTMTQIAEDQKQTTCKELPGVKLDAKERDLVGSMERAIVEGNLDRLQVIADHFNYKNDPGEFQKLAKVVGIDMKKYGVDVSTYRSVTDDGSALKDFGTMKDYAGMHVTVKDKDGYSLTYGVSTADEGNDAQTVNKKGEVVNVGSSRTDQGTELREHIAKETAKSI